MKLAERTLGIIGTGNMGRALVKGLLAAEPRPRIYIYDVAEASRQRLLDEFGDRLQAAADNQELVRRSDLVILAVKPQVIDRVLAEISPVLAPTKLLLSIAAGITLQTLENGIPAAVPVVRVMPNTPALVQAGIAALTAGRHAGKEHLQLAAAVFSRVGKTVIVEEKLMDAVTAVSGSGPAYAFLVVEAMIDAAVDQGLPREIARALVIETIAGSCALLRETGQQPMALKDMVTSPGGTTIAG
ncbi:MAG: pyrroline-5-carboxylate reductase, partial [Deltaproteobacteria bacterium]|nr:pyrroline-5-carboxylate reductase [Deltaproteobacteria bacterium]